MPDLTSPLTASNLQELVLQMQKQMEDLYQDRIGGALLGDVFTIAEDDILAVVLGDGLTKEGNELAVEIGAATGLQFSSGELGVKLKAAGGLTVDSTGLSLAIASLHNVLSSTHGDTTTASVVAGDLMYGNGTPKWDRLAKGAEGTLLRMGASLPAYSTLTMPDTIAAGSVFAANALNVLSAVNSTSGTKLLKNTAGTIAWKQSECTVITSQAEFEAVQTSFPGGLIRFMPGTYTVSGLWTLNADCEIEGNSAKLNFTTDSANQGIRVTASSVIIRGLEISGPQHATYNSTQLGIYAYGSNSANYISNIIIEDNAIGNWGCYGILAENVSGLSIRNNDITGCHYGGITLLSVELFTIDSNRIDDVPGSAGTGLNAYGVLVSRSNQDSLAADGTGHPRSRYGTVSNNVVKNVPIWEAYDTHAGEDITFTGNTAWNCKLGIMIGTAANSAGTYVFAPLNVSVSGNVVDSSKTDGSYGYGIVFQGIAGGEAGTGSVTGNTVVRYGDSTSATGNAFYTYATSGLVISGNSIIEPGSIGMYVSGESKGTVISGNTIIDPWTDTVGVGESYAIKIEGGGGNNTVTISDTHFARASKSATYPCTKAIFIENAAGNVVMIGPNQYTGFTTNLVDAGSKAVLQFPQFGAGLATFSASGVVSSTALGSNVATFLTTPSSANLAAAVTGETGTGALVFATSPALVTPTGIVKGDVGLGNVDNTADASKSVATAGALTSSLTSNRVLVGQGTGVPAVIGAGVTGSILIGNDGAAPTWSGEPYISGYVRLANGGEVRWVDTGNRILNQSGVFTNRVNSSDRHVIASTGIHTMNYYGAGTATFDASGNISSVSDERLKNVRRKFLTGLDAILDLTPIVFKWKKKSGLETKHEYAGFSAQNVQEAIGDLGVGQQEDGYLSLQDRAIIATLVNAVKELDERTR